MIKTLLRLAFPPEEKDLTLAIVEHWPLDAVRVQKIIQEKGGRRVLAIQARQGRFVVKIAAPEKSAAAIARDTAVLEFLHDSRFGHAPAILKTRRGQASAHISGRHVYIMEFVAGRTPAGTPSDWYELGRVTARLHGLTGFSGQAALDCVGLKKELLAAASRVARAPEFRALVEALPDFSTLPAALINTDIGLRNTILRPDGKLILIDWDDAGCGPMILDLGGPLICHFITSRLHFRQEQARSFYQGYAAVRPMTGPEKNALFQAGLFFALCYARYGLARLNWYRIRHAVRNRDRIMNSLQS